MCQLLGLNSRAPTDATFSFTGFCQRGGKTDAHADGWGIGFFENRALRLFVDERSAADSPMARFLRSAPIKSRNTIAHVRKANVGAVLLRNAHPFSRELWGRQWLFAHNGEVPAFQPELTGRFLPVGDTDSEIAFCWLMQSLAAQFDALPSIPALTEALKQLIPSISAHGKFNCLLSNGDAMWAHASNRLCYLVRQHPFTTATLTDEDVSVNFAQLNKPDDRTAVIVSVPLTRDEAWVQFQNNELIVFVDGAPSSAGVIAAHEYPDVDLPRVNTIATCGVSA